MDQRWTAVTLCSIGNMINSAHRIIMPITIVPMADQFKWNIHQQGWILSSFAIGYVTSQFLGSKAVIRYGSKRILAFAVCLWSFSTIITPLVTSRLFLLIFCRILFGIGEGLGLPTIFTIFANHVPTKERPLAFAYLIGAGHVGQTLSALVCPHLYWDLAFYLFGSLGIVWLCVWLGMYRETASNSPMADELPLIDPPSVLKKIRWSKFLYSWTLWTIYIAHFSMNWSNYVIMQWLPTYLARYLGASRSSLSLTAVPFMVNSLFEIVSGRFAEWFFTHDYSILSVRRIMTFIGLFGPGIFLLLLSMVNSLTFALIFVSISMGLCAFNSAGHLSSHADVAPNHASLTFAISNTIATIPGILCGPVTAELVTQSHGRWFPVFTIAAAINFVGAVIFASQSTATFVYQ